MTANELADELDMVRIELTLEAATMLRQQQALIEQLEKTQDYLYKTHDAYKAVIEALKQIIDANNLNQNIGQFVKTANEPVAWFEQDPDIKSVSIWYQSDQDNPNAIPLYTHPVKEQLTDEEIEIEWFKVFKPEIGIGKNLTNGVYEFAMAILKKHDKK